VLVLCSEVEFSVPHSKTNVLVVRLCPDTLLLPHLSKCHKFLGEEGEGRKVVVVR